MKKIILFIFLLIVPNTVSAYAEAYAVMDADSGRILSSSNMYKSYLIASTSKIMTSIVAIENGNLNDKFIASEIINTVYGSMIYAKEDEVFTLEDLLYGLNFRSGNDAAMIIAENIFGYNKFVKKMNTTAVDIGMKNTVFENPHGLDDDTKNYSCAYDLAVLMRYAMKNNTFREITGTKKYIVQTNMNVHEWYNKNKLLNAYKYATGGKIGYTDKSKHVFVSSATKNGKNLIVATIKDVDRYNTHKNLYEETFKKYDKYKILDKYTFSINDKRFKKHHLYIKNDFNMLLKEKEKKLISLDITLNKKIKNNIAGSVNVVLNDKTIHKETLYAVSKSNKIKTIKNLLFFWR